MEAARYQLGRANKETDETLSKSMGNFVSELIGQGNALIESASTLNAYIAKVKHGSV